jgi:Zn-dependent protease
VPDSLAFCAHCGSEVPRLALSCSTCHALVYASQLETLVGEARAAEGAGQPSVGIWTRALALLPPESNQSAVIRDHITSLNAGAMVRTVEKPQPAWLKRLGPVGAAIALVLTKAKFLLLGLGKLQTLLSMLATMGLYWTWFGWKFAVGFVLGIYIHEMGHIWALRQYGLRASAPMFIPGFGAFVSLYDSPANHSQDARIGLAGPLWGLGAGLLCLPLQAAFGGNIWYAIARSTALINLLNLTPIWQLDGGRGFRALNRGQRILILVLIAVLWPVTGEGSFFLLLLGAAYRVFWQKDEPREGDQGALLLFGALLIAFGAMLRLIPVVQ